VYDFTNNRLGVGTSAPTYTLDVSGGNTANTMRIQANAYPSLLLTGYSDASSGQLLYDATPSANRLIIRATSGTPITFETPGNAERMRVAANGTVGIGTTVPAAALDVSASVPGVMVQNGGLFLNNRPAWAQMWVYNSLLQNAIAFEDISTGSRLPTSLPGQFGETPNGWRMGTFAGTGNSNTFLWQRTNPLFYPMAITSNGNIAIGSNYVTPAGILDVSAARTNPAYIRTPLYQRIPVVNVSNATTDTSLTLATGSYGTYYNITVSAFNRLVLPVSVSSNDGGAFWVLRNNTNATLTITLSNTLALTSPLVIPARNNVTLVVDASSNDTIVLF